MYDSTLLNTVASTIYIEVVQLLKLAYYSKWG